METPDHCWKCGMLGHHRQECKVTVSPRRARENKRMAKRAYEAVSATPVFVPPRDAIKFPVS